MFKVYWKTDLFQVVVVTTVSVFISIFAKNKVISIDIPKDNKIIWGNTNVTANVTHMANYTGLRLETFRDNLYGMCRVT